MFDYYSFAFGVQLGVMLWAGSDWLNGKRDKTTVIVFWVSMFFITVTLFNWLTNV